MAFDRRKYPAMLHRRKHEIVGPPLPPEMALARKKAQARTMMGHPGLFLATMGILASNLNRH